MELFVKLTVKDSIVGDLVAPARAQAAKAIPMIMQSGKVVFSRLFADARGGFMVVDVADSSEVSELFSPLVDGWTLMIHPVVPLEELPKVLKRLADMGM
jgi:hypothetical protein